MKLLKKLWIGCALLFVFTSHAQKKERKFNIQTIGFYNVENLFDTINDPNIQDEESPIMKLKGAKSKIYWDKINKLGFVISKIGFHKAKKSPTLIGLAEVENSSVLEDLVASKHLKKYAYGIIHYDSPDKRGIDVALLYNKNIFTPIHHEIFNPRLYQNNMKIYTRDQLLVSGYLGDEKIHLIINHWPSRRGGEAKSSALREKAAYQNSKIIEQIRNEDPLAKILLLGDFNDDPINDSFKKILKTKRKKKNLNKEDLYNPYETLFRKGVNSSSYRDQIHLFDQILCTAPLVNKTNTHFSSYQLFTAHVFNESFLTTQKGKYKGYPFRSFSNGNYIGGYSDHYPVYIYLIKEQ